MSISINFDLKKFAHTYVCSYIQRREREGENIYVIIHRYLKILGIHDFPKDIVTGHYVLHIAQSVPTSMS